MILLFKSFELSLSFKSGEGAKILRPRKQGSTETKLPLWILTCPSHSNSLALDPHPISTLTLYVFVFSEFNVSPFIIFHGFKFLYTIIDRKSTRLNSSHVAISYAVFCLK